MHTPRSRTPARDEHLSLAAAEAGAELHRSYSTGARALRRTWFVFVTLGELVGFCVPAVVGALTWQLGTATSMLMMVLAGAVEGAVLGTSQALVLRREFLGFSRRDWILATSAAAMAAWLLGMLPSAFHETWQGWSLAVTVPLGAALGVLLLVSIGWAQWVVLRRHVARAWLWVVGSALAWCAGLLVFVGITTPLWHEGQDPVLVALVGALGGLAMAATMASVTGVFLVRIVTARPKPIGPPSGIPGQDWEMLADSTDRYAVFAPDVLAGLPEPVQRWLAHAIAPGTPLLTAADAEMSGRIRLGRSWHPFRSRQRISLSTGFLWSTRTRLASLPVTGFDRFTRGSGEMRWRVLGRIRLMAASGDNVTRSAAGRHVAEALALLPATALDPSVSWEPVDGTRAHAYLTVDGGTERVTVSVSGAGRLTQLEMQRWGSPSGCAFGRYPFGACFVGEHSFDGYLVPALVTAGWHIGTARWTEGQFIRYHLTRAHFS